MLMHAFDGHSSADRIDGPAKDVVSTLKRVEEILATQRILAAVLPESPEKAEILTQLDRMKTEVAEQVQSWERRAEPSRKGMHGAGH